MVRRRADGQAGFIITLEFILIMTILGIGVLVGLAAVRNALFKRAVNQRAQTVWVFDDAGIPLGPARDFDDHETPRLFYIDYELSDDQNIPAGASPDPAWVGNIYRAFIGVRDDRFTTRHRLYYSNPDCTSPAGNPTNTCIARAGEEGDDNHGVGAVGVPEAGESPILRGGGIGYLYPLQQGPSYGVGKDLDAVVGGQTVCVLGPNAGTDCTDASECGQECTSGALGETCANDNDCDTDRVCIGGPTPGAICTTNGECTPSQGGTCSDPVAGVCGTPYQCLASSGGGYPGTLYRATNLPCDTTLILSRWTSQNVGESCEAYAIETDVTAVFCPASNSGCNFNNPNVSPQCVTGTTSCECPLGWYRATGVNGNNCCPVGTEFVPNGQAGTCRTAGGDMVIAVPVQRGGENVFAGLTAPFHVNLPPAASSFEFLAPTKEGEPGDPTGIPYDVQDFQFNRAPDGENP